MSTLFGGDIYAGLANLQLESDRFDLGEGLSLRKTYAHLMAPFLMAFRPAPPGGPHPAPWKAASGGFSFDINAELLVPANAEDRYGSKLDVARTVVFLIRLGVDPATTLAAFTNYEFSSLAEIPDKTAHIFPFEVQPRHFALGVVGGQAGDTAMEWVKERWPTAQKLKGENAAFSLAVEAIDSGQFVQNDALTLVSLWGALEALFSPSTLELRFRVSSLIAAFLEPPGDKRLTLQRNIVKLYDKRSAAAHGKPQHEPDDLLSTFELLRRVLMAIIDKGTVPTKESLENALFGA